MSVAAAYEEPVPETGRDLLDRVYAAIPIVFVFVCFAGLYVWEASRHHSPWLFVDELELSQISRAIAATGHAARRGEPYTFKTLYTYPLALAWLFHGTPRAYAIAKYIGVFTMTMSVFPAYFLARLVASRRAALVAAAGAAAIPAFAYSDMIIEEPLAYTWACLCFFLIAKALITRSPPWMAAAIAAAVVAHWIRAELTVLLAVLGGSALAVGFGSERGRRWRSTWSARHWLGAAVLLTGALLVFAAVMNRSHTWEVATGSHRTRTIECGLWALGSLTIGLGVLPVVAALAVFFQPRGQTRSCQLRVLAAVFWTGLIVFGIYTAVKAGYLSTGQTTLILERNLIYLAPPVFAAMAVWLDRRHLRFVPVVVAAGLVGYLLAWTPYSIDAVPNSDAFGLSLLATANRDLAFAPGGIQWLLLGVLGVALLLLLGPRVLVRTPYASGVVAAVAAVLVLAWNVAGGVSAGTYSNDAARARLAAFPKPPDWLDIAGKGQPVAFLGQDIDQGEAINIWTLEFWNTSLKYVWSLDGTAPRPGKILTPDLIRANGRLFPDPRAAFVLTDARIGVVGTPLRTPPGLDWQLYRISHPLRLAHTVTGISPDGWSGTDAAYSLFRTEGGRSGYVTVSVSRTAWRGPDKPGHVTIRLGRLIKGPDKQPHLGQVTAVRTWTVHSGIGRNFRIPTPRPPIRVEVHVSPLFSPHDYGLSDRRQLGAQITFSFTPR